MVEDVKNSFVDGEERIQEGGTKTLT